MDAGGERVYSGRMSLRTFDVPEMAGYVRFVTPRESYSDVTVECPGIRSAFRLRIPSSARLAVGQWVALSGRLRFDPGLKASGKPREENLQYIHKPHDGGEHWFFFDFDTNDVSVRVVPPPPVAAAIEAALARLKLHLDAWAANASAAELMTTLKSVTTAERALSRVFRGCVDLEAKVVSTDVTL